MRFSDNDLLCKEIKVMLDSSNNQVAICSLPAFYSYFIRFVILSYLSHFTLNAILDSFHLADEMITKNLKEWRGYIHVPIEAVTCSDVCADAIMDEWTLLHEEEEKVQEKVCFDVEEFDEDLERLWKHRRRLRKEWRKEWLVNTNKCLCFG